jgi:hypothetical protein
MDFVGVKEPIFDSCYSSVGLENDSTIFAFMREQHTIPDIVDYSLYFGL